MSVGQRWGDGPNRCATPTKTAGEAPVFSQPRLLGLAEDAANFGVIGPDGHALTVTSASYDPTDDSVTLRTSQKIDPKRSYRLTVDGSRAGGIVNILGVQLDGLGLGLPGSNFSRTLTPGGLADPAGGKEG